MKLVGEKGGRRRRLGRNEGLKKKKKIKQSRCEFTSETKEMGKARMKKEDSYNGSGCRRRRRRWKMAELNRVK